MSYLAKKAIKVIPKPVHGTYKLLGNTTPVQSSGIHGHFRVWCHGESCDGSIIFLLLELVEQNPFVFRDHTNPELLLLYRSPPFNITFDHEWFFIVPDRVLVRRRFLCGCRRE